MMQQKEEIQQCRQASIYISNMQPTWEISCIAIQKAKGLIKHNGFIMREVIKIVTEKLIVDKFDLINDRGEKKTTPCMKQALAVLLTACQNNVLFFSFINI